jgi:TonB family protein
VVLIDLQVSRKGKADRLNVIEERGQRVGDAALRAIPSWKFEPVVLRGKATEASATIELRCGAEDTAAVAPEAGSGTEKPDTRPAVVYKIDPGYSEAARKAKYQGSIVLSLMVDTSGHAVDIRVVRPLGLGLDLKAVQAINQWRFKPGIKNGKPINVGAHVEVRFRLL